VKGKITATSGTVGGFTINSNYISYNNQTWEGTNTTGIYIGISGIQLGKNFKVDNAGNLYAYSGTFEGYVNAGSIRYGVQSNGVDYGTLSGSSLASRSVGGSAISLNTLTTSNMIDGIRTSLSYADYANGVFTGYNTASQIACDQLSSAEIIFDRRKLGTTEISYVDAKGKSHALKVVTWSWR
jgi:hypothetical protein